MNNGEDLFLQTFKSWNPAGNSLFGFTFCNSADKNMPLNGRENPLVIVNGNKTNFLSSLREEGKGRYNHSWGYAIIAQGRDLCIFILNRIIDQAYNNNILMGVANFVNKYALLFPKKTILTIIIVSWTISLPFWKSFKSYRLVQIVVQYFCPKRVLKQNHFNMKDHSDLAFVKKDDYIRNVPLRVGYVLWYDVRSQIEALFNTWYNRTNNQVKQISNW